MKKKYLFYSFGAVLVFLLSTFSLKAEKIETIPHNGVWVTNSAPPVVTQTLKPLTRYLNMGMFSIYLDEYFDNSMGTLTYSAISTDQSIIDLSVNGSMLDLYFNSVGQVDIEVTATDGTESSIQTFTVRSLSQDEFVQFNATELDNQVNQICGPLSQVVFNNNSFMGNHLGIRYEWFVYYNNETEQQFSVLELITDLNPGDYDVRLTAFNQYNEMLGDYNNHYFIDGITDFNILPKQSVCPDEELLFELRGSHNWVTWEFPNGEILQGNYMPYSFPNTGTFPVKMTADDVCSGEIVSIVKDVFVGATVEPIAHFYTPGDWFCINDPIPFYIDKKGNYTSVEWDFGNGETSTEIEPVYAFKAPGEKTITLTVTNNCGLSASYSQIVTIGDQMEAYADFNMPDMVCPNSEVYFHALGSGFFEWDFGDGTFSDKQEPVNVFSEGVYDVTLKVINGCGNAAQTTKTLTVQPMPTGNIPDINIQLQDEYGREYFAEMISICPGDEVFFKNHSYSDPSQGVRYLWEVNNQTIQTKDFRHVFEQAGTFTVTATAVNGCGDMNEQTVTIDVSPGITPQAVLRATPDAICPGEEVYFWDDDHEGDKRNYVYHIDFGDGNASGPITEPTDGMIEVLAKHVYPNEGIYDVVFDVTNSCGNTQTLNHQVTVDTDATRESFYFVENSTVESESPAPNYPKWDASVNPVDEAIFNIPVHFADWDQSNSNVYIFFWYGGFNPDMPPDGFTVGTLTPDATNGGGAATLTAYIPVGSNLEVGILAGWYANDDDFGDEPQAHAPPLDGTMNPIFSFPLTKGATTDVPLIEIQDRRILGEWQYFENGIYHFLDLWEEAGMYQYQIYLSPNPWGDPSTYVASGSFMYYSQLNELHFTNEPNMTCQEVGSYLFTLTENTLSLAKKGTIADVCLGRRNQLLDKTFERKHEYSGENNRAACPGDNVLFKIAGGSSYVWDFGDGSPTTTEQFPLHAYTQPGEYIAKVTATNTCGRVDVIETTVIVDDTNLPNANFWTENNGVFVYEPVLFRVDLRDDAQNASYEWDFGDGEISTERTPNHVYLEEGEYEVTLKVTNGCGSNVNKQTVYVEKPLKDCFARFKTSVTDLTVSFTNLSSLNAHLFNWDFGNGIGSDLKAPTHTYSQAGVYDVTLNIVDTVNKCSDMITKTITVGTLNCFADFDVVVNAADKTVDFINNSTGNDLAYFWDFGNGFSSELKDPSYTFMYGGYKHVCLTIVDLVSGCEAHFCKEIFIGLEEFKADFTFFVEGNTVVFTNETMGYATDFYWTFGDGNFSEEVEAAYTYQKPGEYTVCLNAVNPITDQHHQVCKTIKVGTLDCNIEADFTFFPKENNTIAFKNNSIGEGITNTFWMFGDGQSATTFDAEHAYLEPGYYVVGVGVANADKTCHDAFFDLVKVGTAECFADFEYNVNVNATGQSQVDFTNLSEGTTYYLWNFGDGDFSLDFEPTHYYNPGYYGVDLVVTDQAGTCFSHAFDEIQIGQVNCNAKFDYFIDPDTYEATFTNAVMGDATEYLWSFGDGNFSKDANPVHQYSVPGYYPVHLTVYNETTWCIDEYFEVLTVGSPGNDIEAGFNYILVADEASTVKFHNQSYGENLTYTWNFGDNSALNNEKSPKHTFPADDFYNVCLTITDANGMQNTYCEFIQVGADANDCFSDFTYMVDPVTNKVQFESKAKNATKYSWIFGDGTQATGQTVTHTYTDEEVYEVIHLIANEDTKCGSRSIKLVSVKESDGSIYAGFDYNVNESNGKPGYPVDFTGASLGGSSKSSWDFDDGGKGKSTDETTTTPMHVYSSPGVYTVCFTASDPNTGKTATACKDVDVQSTTGLFNANNNKLAVEAYPNPFSDNTRITYSITENTTIKISVYNPVGEKLVTLKDEQQAKGNYSVIWNADDMPNGIYYIKLESGLGSIVKKVILSK